VDRVVSFAVKPVRFEVDFGELRVGDAAPLQVLMTAFTEVLAEQEIFRGISGAI
jgi:hypothetical protein